MTSSDAASDGETESDSFSEDDGDEDEEEKKVAHDMHLPKEVSERGMQKVIYFPKKSM